MSDGNLKIGAIVDIEQLHAGMASSVQEIKSATSQMGASFQQLSTSHSANMRAISDDTKAMASSVSPAFVGVAKASLEISAALKEQRAAMAEARASAGQDTEALNVLAAAKQRVATATLELAEAQQLAGIRTDNLGRATGEATGALALMGDEIGVRLNRHLRNFVGEMAGIGPLMASAFSVFAVVGLIEVVQRAREKLGEMLEGIAGLTAAVKAQDKALVDWNHHLLVAFDDIKRGTSYLHDTNTAIERNSQEMQRNAFELTITQRLVGGLTLGIGNLVAYYQQWNRGIDENVKLTEQQWEQLDRLNELKRKAAEETQRQSERDHEAADRAVKEQDRTNQEIEHGIAERDDRILQANKHLASEQKRLDKETADALEKSMDDVDRAYVKSFEKKQEEARRANAEIEDAAIEHARNLLKIETETLNFELAIDKITTQDKIKELKKFEQQEYESEKLAAQAKLALYQEGTREYEVALKQLQKIEDQHRQQQIQLDRQAALDRVKVWQGFSNSIGATFHTSLTGMIQGTQTFQKAFQKMGADILAGFVDTLFQMEVQWRLTHAIMSLVSKVFHLDQLAQETAGNAEKIAMNAATNIQEVISASGVAFANAYAAYAAFPPIAAAMGAQAQGTVLGVGLPLASAAGGMVVEHSEQLALLHKNEMVLPSDIAGPLRQNLSAGGGQDIASALRGALRGARFGPSADEVADAVVRKFKREFGRNG